jgi:hypothetical protein
VIAGGDELLLIRGYRARGAPTNADEQELIPTVQRDGGSEAALHGSDRIGLASEAALQELGNKITTPTVIIGEGFL